ncbi:MAG: SDR family NAD(P)-dependent oxidoreductase [Treponema sp.]|nr:SDR family NAD(P)-dependent oxidoreductase [Treponema sp.]
MKKIIVVTGASSGMGASFARQLAEESAGFLQRGKTQAASDEIWIVARRKDRLEALKKEIEGLGEGIPFVRVIDMDISGRDGARALGKLFSDEASAEGSLFINVLVNNAGFGTYGEFAETDVEREMEMVDLDCTSLTGITGYALPFMGKGSRLINTASLASFLPLGNFAVYGACKAYVLSFTVALAAELKQKGIRVTALCPGPVSTEFANVASRGARKEVKHGLSAEKTVAHCIRKSRRGSLYALMAFKWKIASWASKLVPRYTCAWFTYKFNKRPSN